MGRRNEGKDFLSVRTQDKTRESGVNLPLITHKRDADKIQRKEGFIQDDFETRQVREGISLPKNKK